MCSLTDLAEASLFHLPVMAWHGHIKAWPSRRTSAERPSLSAGTDEDLLMIIIPGCAAAAAAAAAAKSQAASSPELAPTGLEDKDAEVISAALPPAVPDVRKAVSQQAVSEGSIGADNVEEAAAIS